MARVDPIHVRTIQQLSWMGAVAVGRLKRLTAGADLYIAILDPAARHQRYWDVLLVETRRPRDRAPSPEEIEAFQKSVACERTWAEIWIWRCVQGTRDLPPRQRRYALSRFGMHGGHPS